MVNFDTFTNDILEKREIASDKKTDTYQHISIAFTGNVKKSINVLAIGLNESRPKKIHSTHAEMKVAEKLPISRKYQRIDIFVGRTGKSRNSKPCIDCLQTLLNLYNKGYIVNKIYYTNEEKIIKRTLNELLKDKEIHMSKYFRNMRKKNNVNI